MVRIHSIGLPPEGVGGINRIKPSSKSPGYEMSTVTWSRPKPHGTKGACVNTRPCGVPQVRVKKYLKR